jgi:phospholipase C
VANPIKKRIIKTECEVHKFINKQGLVILKNDGYKDAFNFFSEHIKDINEGAVWADQDFKSSNHFYDPERDKGMFGRSNALKESEIYYEKAVNHYYNGDIHHAMFYLGASCHLVQDVTVPQHVNVNLLNRHRNYEQWIIKVYKQHDDFKVTGGGIYYTSIKKFVSYNSKNALAIYNKYHKEENINLRYYNIACRTISIAQKTTAGMFLKFYNCTKKVAPANIKQHKIKYKSFTKNIYCAKGE